MRIIGIDPSLVATGVAVTRNGKWLRLSVLKNKLRGHERMQFVLNGIMQELDLLDEGDLVVMEGPSYNSRGQSTHELAGLWWMVRHLIWRYPHLSVVIVPPAIRAKYATGKGNAKKEQVSQAVQEDYPDAVIADHNVADAMIFAAMGARSIGAPMDHREPGSPELDAYSKVEWAHGV